MRGIRALQLLIWIEIEIDVRGARFGGVAFIHRTQVSVAAHFEFLQPPLFVQARGQRVAAHDVLVLLSRSAACKSETHRRLFKYRLLGMDRDRLGTRAL